MTVQGLFPCKHGHPDIAPAKAYLTTLVQKPKSCRLDQVLSTAVISQANCEGQANPKCRWLSMP